MRESVKARTQQKIMATIFAGVVAAGFFAPKAKEESYESVYKKQPAAEVTVNIEKPQTLKEKQIGAEEKAELERLDKLIAELDGKVDEWGNLMRLVAELQKNKETFVDLANQKPKEFAREPLRVSNFEKEGIDSEMLANLAKETYPSSWQYHVYVVEFKNKYEEVGVGYGPRLEASTACAKTMKSENTINFFKGCENQSVQDILQHEFAHMVDWNGNRIMSIKDRLEFLRKVLQRIEEPNRFISESVELIDHRDGQLKNFKKSSEYWAYVMEEYLKNPDSQKLAREDLDLIKWFLAKTDPDFDAKDALKKRLAYTTPTIDENGRVSQPKLLAKAEYGTINKSEY